MKKATWLLIGLLTFPMMICAQSHHNDLTWTASIDTGVTYNVYRASGACPATGIPAGATKIGSGVSVLNYSDTNVAVGDVWCYYVTAQAGSLESGPSNTAGTSTKPGKPGILTVIGN